MITMMVLLCYVNLSGMSLECIVIVLMNNSLLGGQECTDYVDVEQRGNANIGQNRQSIIPRLNFTCNGTITNITARLRYGGGRDNYPFIQVWRPASVGSTIYNKIGEVQLQSDDQVTGSGDYRTANIILTGNNTIEVQSGDVVGYYHPPDARHRVRTIRTDGYIHYEFRGSHDSVNLNNNIERDDQRQPLIQFTISKYAFIQAQLLAISHCIDCGLWCSICDIATDVFCFTMISYIGSCVINGYSYNFYVASYMYNSQNGIKRV